MLQSLTDLQRKIDSGREGSKSNTRRRRRTSSGSFDSEESSRDTISSPHKRRRRKHHRDRSQDEFRKAKPPTFDGEIKTVLRREIPMAWGTTTDSSTSEINLSPICNRNKISNTKGSDFVPYSGRLK